MRCWGGGRPGAGPLRTDKAPVPAARGGRPEDRRSGSLLLGAGSLAEAGLEAGHAATGVEDLLLARVERVALGADIGADGAAGDGATRGERRATGAAHLGLDVLGVDVALQGVS
ncbi:hypothetical protein SFR_1961 [Streptomyces sp. FR-008]|nr:hypothetical protein SFR_1961 [Streptomyces sp. FR-008]